MRLFVPPAEMTLDDYRVGPLGWHPISPYDAAWAASDRSSECDDGRGQTAWMEVAPATGAPGPLVQRGARAGG